jgi:hypothetical protein
MSNQNGATAGQEARAMWDKFSDKTNNIVLSYSDNSIPIHQRPPDQPLPPTKRVDLRLRTVNDANLHDDLSDGEDYHSSPPTAATQYHRNRGIGIRQDIDDPASLSSTPTSGSNSQYSVFDPGILIGRIYLMDKKDNGFVASVYEFVQAHLHERVDGTDNQDVKDYVDVNDNANTNGEFQEPCYLLVNAMEEIWRFMPSPLAKERNAINNKFHANFHIIYRADVHVHASTLVMHSLVDREANGVVANSDVQVIYRTDRIVKIQGIDNHMINDVYIDTARGLLQTNKGPANLVFRQYALPNIEQTTHDGHTSTTIPVVQSIRDSGLEVQQDIRIDMEFSSNDNNALCLAPCKYPDKVHANYECPSGMQPSTKLDATELRNDKDKAIYELLISILQWLTGIDRSDIPTPVMALSSFRVVPSVSHLNRITRMVGNLAKQEVILFRTGEPDRFEVVVPTCDWSKLVYGSSKGMISQNADTTCENGENAPIAYKNGETASKSAIVFAIDNSTIKTKQDSNCFQISDRNFSVIVVLMYYWSTTDYGSPEGLSQGIEVAIVGQVKALQWFYKKSDWFSTCFVYSRSIPPSALMCEGPRS